MIQTFTNTSLSQACGVLFLMGFNDNWKNKPGPWRKKLSSSLWHSDKDAPNHLPQHPTLSWRSGQVLSCALCSIRANLQVVIQVKSKKHCMCILTVTFPQIQQTSHVYWSWVVSLRSACKSVFSLFCILDVYLASRLIRKQSSSTLSSFLSLLLHSTRNPCVPAVNMSSCSQLNTL